MRVAGNVRSLRSRVTSARDNDLIRVSGPRSRGLVRVRAVGGSFAVDAALEAIRRAWSMPSRIGQLRARAPMTSTCFSKEPWSQ
jgi:hypothetical protein